MSGLLLSILIFIHVASALGIIGLVLIQHGKGADMGAAFGSGVSGSLFGATGSANFLSRMTAVLASIFFLASLALAYTATNKPKEGKGVMETIKTEPASKTPATPSTVPAPTPGSQPAIPVPTPTPNSGAATTPAPADNSKAKEIPK